MRVFSEILRDAMVDAHVSGAKLQELLEERGIYDIKRKRINAYVKGEYTPSYEKAKNLLETLNYDTMSDEDIVESLRLNRINVAEHNKEKELLANSGYAKKITLRIRARNLSFDRNSDALDNEQRMRDRATEKYGTPDLTRYIEELIAADLDSISKRRDENEENKKVATTWRRKLKL